MVGSGKLERWLSSVRMSELRQHLVMVVKGKGTGWVLTGLLLAALLTWGIGKWDVSNRKPIIERMPNAQGFDYFFGALGANDGGMVKFHENNEASGSSKDMGGLTTLYTDKSIKFLGCRSVRCLSDYLRLFRNRS